MKFDDKLLQDLENLSKIKLSDEERENFKDYMEEASEYFGKLSDVNFEEGRLLGTIAEGIFRQDDAVDFPDKNEILYGAKGEYDRYFSVPAVLDGDIKS